MPALCSDCKCGMKKVTSKNKAEEGRHISNPSAFAGHRRAVYESEVEIKVNTNPIFLIVANVKAANISHAKPFAASQRTRYW